MQDQPPPIAEHWPNVVSLLLDATHARTLQQSAITDDAHAGCVWHVDANARSGASVTYVLHRVEARVLLLLVFKRALKRANDAIVSEFCRSTVERLRLLPLLRGALKAPA